MIVEIAGQTIANIYDYTYALEVLKIGEPVEGRLSAKRRAAGDDADAWRAKVAAREPPDGSGLREREGGCHRRADESVCLLGSDVACAGSLRRLLLVEADALPFGQRVEAPLNRAAVEEIFLAAGVANKPETLVALNTLDRTARHPRLLPVVTARRVGPRVQRLDRNHYTTASLPLEWRCIALPQIPRSDSHARAADA